MSLLNSFDNYFFTSDVIQFACPGFGSALCVPPSACAHNPKNGFTYCCDAKLESQPDQGRVCWSLGKDCMQDGTTIGCGGGNRPRCCLGKTASSEACAQGTLVTNTCWSIDRNTLQDINSTILNNTYLSLSSAKPNFPSWTFDPVTLIAATQTPSNSSILSSSSPSITAFSTPSPKVTEIFTTITIIPNDSTRLTNPTTSLSSPSTHISGGAIGGIVVSAIVVITVAVGFSIYFLKKRNKQKVKILGGSVSIDDGWLKAELSSQRPLQELFSHERPQELSSHDSPQEMSSQESPRELGTTTHQ